jgi:UDP-3-O-[3-hydroxymyristoyl] glucosamine N-acyltransferase
MPEIGREMGVSLTTIIEKFPELLKLEKGEKSTPVSRLQTPRLAEENDLIFISEPKHLSEAAESRSKIWILKEKMLADVPKSFTGALLSSPNPYLAMALIGKEFFPLTTHHIPVDGLAIHPSAVISKSARVGARVKIGPGAIVSDGVVLEDDCVIGANTVLEPNVKIGKKTVLHPLVFIGHDCEVGSDCDIKPHTTIGGEGFGFAPDQNGFSNRITHYGRVVVENRVHIGSNVQIDRGTFEDSRIGEGTKIDNHCHFGHNIVVGKNTIIVGGMIAAGSVTIGSQCVIAGRATVAGHLKIGDRVHIGGLSGVSKTVEGPGQFAGHPLQPIKEDFRTRATLPVLPRMRKQISQILKKLEMDDHE